MFLSTFKMHALMGSRHSSVVLSAPSIMRIPGLNPQQKNRDFFNLKCSNWSSVGDVGMRKGRK